MGYDGVERGAGEGDDDDMGGFEACDACDPRKRFEKGVVQPVEVSIGRLENAFSGGERSGEELGGGEEFSALQVVPAVVEH